MSKNYICPKCKTETEAQYYDGKCPACGFVAKPDMPKPLYPLKDYIKDLLPDLVSGATKLSIHKAYIIEKANENDIAGDKYFNELTCFLDLFKECVKDKKITRFEYNHMLMQAQLVSVEKDTLDKLLKPYKIVGKLIENASAKGTQTETEKKVIEKKESKAQEEAELKALVERIEKEKAQLQKKLDAERKAREEAERKAREEAERKAREEAERKKIPLRIENGVVYCTEEGYEGPIDIPSSINGERVIAIGDKAFYHCSCCSVRIPDSVSKIGEKAFSGCCRLSEIVIPDSVHTISDFAFASCTNLTKVVLPKHIEYIPLGAFEMCAFRTIQIPDSVRFIHAYAFSPCKELIEIVIPKNVEFIDRTAFGGCWNLRNVRLMSRNTRVEGRPFDRATLCSTSDAVVSYM